MRVLVAGASSSVGRYVVDRLLTAGHRVEGPSRRDLDLVDEASIRFFAQHLGKVDAVAVLAGILPGKRLEEYGAEEIDRVMRVNFSGPALLLREVHSRLRDGGRVVLVASVAGERGSYDPIYAASKAALIGLAKSLAVAWAPRVRVNAVSPGLIEGSTMAGAMVEGRREHHLRRTPTGKLTTLPEIAEVVADLLASPAWANLNGQVIRVDGGADV